MVLAITLDELTSSLVIGLITGAAYSLVALGLVLIYKSSGVFNFAQGEFGTVAAYGAYIGTELLDVPYGLAIVIGLGMALAMGLLTERLIIRPLFDAPRVTLLVATAAIALLSIGIQFWRTNANPVKVLPPISQESERVEIFGVLISDQRLITLVVLAAVAVALAAFFRSPLGLAVLASSQEPVASELVGVSVRRISALTWGLAALLGGIAGILLAPNQPFTPGFQTSAAGALIPGFTAAVVGGITSLPGAAIAGLMIGMLQALGSLSTFSDIPGASSVTVFVLLLIILLVRPQGLFLRKART